MKEKKMIRSMIFYLVFWGIFIRAKVHNRTELEMQNQGNVGHVEMSAAHDGIPYWVRLGAW